MDKIIGTSTVKRGRGFVGLAGFEVVNPDGDRMPPGRTVLVCPVGDEAPAWRAILAGVLPDGNPVVVPLQGHFGALMLRKLSKSTGVGLSLSADAPVDPGRWNAGDECAWFDAKVLALSTAQALSLHGLTF